MLFLTSFMPLTYLMSTQGTSPDVWHSIVQSNILNVIVAAVFLAWVIRKINVGRVLDERRQRISEELATSETRRQVAQAELDALEKRAASLHEEVAAIIRDAEQTARQVADAILTSAEGDAAAIRANAQKRQLLDEKNAARSLEARLMREALHGAQQFLETTLSDEDKRQSVEAFIEALPELAKTGGLR
jgi:F-type H+-transporting ATPase subunit b